MRDKGIKLAYNLLVNAPVDIKIHISVMPYVTYEHLFWIDPE